MDASFQDVCALAGIVIRDPGGSERRVLADGAYYPDNPAWSPDGSKIAFSGYPYCDWNDPRPCVPDIYVMNADGSSVARLTTSTGSGSSLPEWTPDGGRIAYVALTYVSPGNVTMGLRIMNADGSGDTTLGDLAGTTPAWSPDGTQLAYSVPHHERSWGIYVADADGSNPRPLTGEPDARDARPSWSPDGRKIAFSRAWTHPDGSGSCQVFVMNADGSNLSQLTSDSFCAHNPAWSPDGTLIAYNGIEAEGSYGIKLMNPDGAARGLIRPTLGWPSRVTWAQVP